MTSPVVCILGMHRSGTSVLAAMLETMGVYLGEAHERLPPLAENPRGYWEHRDIRDLNEDVLHRLHGSWHTPPPLPEGWENAPALQDARDRARALVARFERHRLWGWKDPRACIMLPFWKAQMPPMRYVFCVRNPIDVARSLAHRDDLPFDHAIRLWLVHNACALHLTENCARTFVSYEALVADPDAVAVRLASLIDVHSEAAVPAGIVSADLRHHRAPAAQVFGDTRVPEEVRSLYGLLATAASRPPLQHETPAGDAVELMRRLAKHDEARGEQAWFVWFVRGYMNGVAASDEAFGQRRPVSASRQRVRAFLGDRPALGNAYRSVRRTIRRAFRLGP